MSSTNPGNDNMTFELRLQQEQLAAYAGSAAGVAFETVYNWNSDLHNYDSDDEEESWTHRSNRNSRRVARIDTNEATQSDSDSEQVDQQRDAASLSIDELRRQILQGNEQGDVSEADRVIFEEYFGDRLRGPTSPNGRGWQNRARIAAGERISNAIYGTSIDAIRDTSLEEPVVTSAYPPPGLCAARRRARRRIDAETERAVQAHETDRAIRTRERALALQAAHGRFSDACEDSLRTHRRSNDLNALINQLKVRATAFKEKDSAGFDAWANHITVAHACSTSKSRQHQIIQWYTRGVPGRVLRQVRRVEVYYTTEAFLKERLAESQSRAGDGRGRDRRQDLTDDDVWAGNEENLFFGYDAEKPVNGFQDYVPKGEGAAMIKHLTSNFEARKTRLQHASRQHFSVLGPMVDEFASRATLVLDEGEPASGADPALQALMRHARDALRQYRSNPPRFQSKGEPSPSAAGVHRTDGNDGNESDASDVPEIVNRMRSAAIMFAATTLHQRGGLTAEIEGMLARPQEQIAHSDDEEAPGGNVPPDGEDDDGDESMDESSD